jgi:hypothetical protein
MQKTHLTLRVLASKQALLEIELDTLFGLQVDDVFPSAQEGETVLSFRIEADQAGEHTPLQTYLEQKKAAGFILEITPIPLGSHEPINSLPVLRVQSRMVYVLDEQSASEFDAKRAPSRKRFARLLPGSNAYLLEFDAFEPLEYPDLDPGDSELGCFVSLDPALSEEHRQHLLVGLTSQGYALSLYPDALLLTAWHRDVLKETVDRDIQRILSALGHTVPGQTHDPAPTAQEARAYPITSVDAEDLQASGFTDEEVAQLSEYLPEIAEKMADVYLETRFWNDLRFFAEAVLRRVSPPEKPLQQL